jgi:hypothetical protein
MTYSLPAKLPNELLCDGKVYKVVSGKTSVNRGVCTSNTGQWLYYFNKEVVAGKGNIGARRHFSVNTGAGQRSVHISLKSNEDKFKADNIMIWYRFDEQWTGRKREEAGWGKTKFRGQDADRVRKAVALLTKFLEAMTAVAEGGTGVPKAAIAPVLSPPLAALPDYDWEAIEAAFSARSSEPASAPMSLNLPDVDDWEDLL